MRKHLKIAHLTSKKQLAETLSNFQSGPNLEVLCHIFHSGEAVKTEDLANTDVLHLHGLDLLSSKDLLSLVDQRIKNKEIVIISLFDDVNLLEDTLKESVLKNSEILNESSAVFIQDSSLLPMLDTLYNWTWCGSPISSPIENASEADFEPKDGIKFLYHQMGSDTGFQKKLEENFNLLRNEGQDISLSSFNSSTTPEEECLKMIANSHVLIDCNSSPALNRFTLTAFSLGKTVLASLPEDYGRLSKQFEYAPFLKTEATNLYYRMKSLCMQPKSLRDFGRRGVRYIKDYHNPTDICNTYLDIYRQFV